MADTQVLQQIKWNFRRSLAWLRADKGGSCCWKCNLAPPGKGCHGWRCPLTLPRSIRRLISNRGKKSCFILIKHKAHWLEKLTWLLRLFPPDLSELDVLWDTLHTLLMSEAVILFFSISFSTVSYTHNYARFCQGSCNFFRLRLFCPGKTLQTAEGAFVNVCLCVFCRSEGISWSALLHRDSYNVTTPCPVLLIKWHGKVSCRLVLLALSVFSLQRCVLTSLTRVATIGLMQGWFPDLNELFNC